MTRIGHFDNQEPGRQLVAIESLQDPEWRWWGRKAGNRDVGRDIQIGGPTSQWATSATVCSRTVSERDDEPGLLRQRDELARTGQAQLGMTPSHEGLGPGPIDRSRCRGWGWKCITNVVALDGPADRRLERHPLHHVLRMRESNTTRLARPLSLAAYMAVSASLTSG